VTGLVTRSDVRLVADPERVLARLFVAGQEFLINTESRATGVLRRVLALSEEHVEEQVAAVRARYTGRHRDLPEVLRSHFEQIAHRIPAGIELSAAQRELIGAFFTNEYAIEGAALFNPSAVAHPDQTSAAPGALRFVMSLRAVGEGHLSSVEFRTGTFGPGDAVRVDDPGEHVETGRVLPTAYDRTLFAAQLTEAGADAESATFIVQRLTARFDAADLEIALAALTEQRVTRPGGARVDELARRIAAGSYEIEFASASTMAERVLWPQAPAESHGMEDVRFVRATDGATPAYRATYTAFDGSRVEPQMIETDDFRHFRISQLTGPAAKNKGMALFPRRVGGRHVALSRWDRENNAIAYSDDGLQWDEPLTLHGPTRAWELTQTGNCGSPVETEAGWLVLTHGVGPMREYAIGALLLDLAEPHRIIGDLGEPLLRPADDERDGYVPNVVYSCGPLRHGDRLLLPYGASDASVRFAVVDLPALLDRMTG
jgi:predicted GH43/DUF377 family glycosyl hydrolase